MASSTPTLAGGCFGKIYMVKYGDTWAAMKKVPLSLLSKTQLERECKVYNNARHPHVVKLLGNPWLKESKWHIPLEFIFGEDLETTIFKAQISKIQLTQAVKDTIISGMCEGLLHLHSKDIVHQDLKPDNIMVEHQTHRAVIIDLGLAKFFKNGLTSAMNLGNEAYSAPEILQMNGVRDKRSDVWAMGKIIAELCARVRLPTQYVSASKIQETLKDQPYCIPVSNMVEVNPKYRATMAAVISDIRRAGSTSQMDMRQRDVTVTQTNEVRGNQKWCPQVFTLSMLNTENPYWQDSSQKRVVVKTLVPLKGESLNNQQSLMSFPCPLPETGKVTQQRYTERKGVIEYKEIVTEGGRVTKYEKVQIRKTF
ncbi:uncharacterized protein LOC127453179 [Myxocyprinus asiaticus]|uniref:uncharacterized protein LOC127453179 n=1 Tax=Myxocyprinus asiaticus TaxID=70543 RepID=UPI0022224B46|nr:uncharacterized protein LOC127453179 [Myxocyprinus asiaticus]XP_051575365.1 uncharacterized protein LOC127453179 [Myxocyprinus asiaticus]